MIENYTSVYAVLIYMCRKNLSYNNEMPVIIIIGQVLWGEEMPRLHVHLSIPVKVQTGLKLPSLVVYTCTVYANVL